MIARPVTRSPGPQPATAPVHGRSAHPLPPTFATVEEERLHRKQRLAAAFRLFAHFGYEEGVAGHITAPDPELTDHFWVNPFGEPFGHMRVRDHAARPDVVAAAHSHSMHGRAGRRSGGSSTR